jgi:hypothetical protein
MASSYDIAWQTTEPTWNDGDIIRCSDEAHEENKYSPYRMTTETQICISLNHNSVALVGKQNIPTERQPLVGEVSANFCR